MYFALGCFAALLFVYSLISEKVERLSLSGPIVFVAVGVALGPLGLEWFNPSVNFGNGKLLIDLTLALFLFVDAASANLSVLKKKIGVFPAECCCWVCLRPCCWAQGWL